MSAGIVAVLCVLCFVLGCVCTSVFTFWALGTMLEGES